MRCCFRERAATASRSCPKHCQAALSSVALRRKNVAGERLLSVAGVSAVDTASSAVEAAQGTQPLLLRALQGERVDRPPVWMMRQAGRYMKVYQDLCKKHKTFRERSENVDLAVEISLQPWKAFQPDGVILFSDILTPLPGMNIPFDIATGQGPVIHSPIRTMEQVNEVTRLEAGESVPFVGESLKILRQEVGNRSAVLGFVGAPFTLATYIIEGRSSKHFAHTKKMAFSEPQILHKLLTILAENVADYIRYQADAGAQMVQIFDSWAAHLQPQDFDVFSGPYIKQVTDSVRKTHPQLPIVLYISGSGGLLERMAACNPDIISFDQSVDMVDGIKRVGSGFAIQGNMDPGALFGSKPFISKRVKEIIRQAKSQGVRHVMNLGHGIHPGTPEANVACYFEAAKEVVEQ